jgi:hypothetical protein
MEYARGEDKAADKAESDRVEIHNNLRNAAAAIVGLEIAANHVLARGAIASAINSKTDNFYTMQQLASGKGTLQGFEMPAKVATTFARLPFVAIRKEGQDGLILSAKPMSTRLVINPFDPDQERLLQKLFPGYKHPTEYKREGRNTKPNLMFGEDGNLESVVDQATFLKLVKGEFSPYMQDFVRETEEFQAVKTLPKGVGVSLTMRLFGNNNYITEVGGLPYTIADSGALPRNSAVVMAAEIVAELHLPLDYAWWTLYCESKEEFVPFMFMTHINSIIRAASGATDDKATATFTQDLKGRAATAWKRAKPRKPTPMAMARRNRKKEERTGYVPMVRTNEDGYLITGRNRVIRLPKENKMAEYQSASNEWFESLSAIDMSKLTEGSRDRDAPKFRFPPSVLYVDHHNEVMVFTTIEGTVSSLNLRGARALDPITIAKMYPYALRGIINGSGFGWNGDRFKALSVEGRTLFEMVKRMSAVKDASINRQVNALVSGCAIPPTQVNPLKVDFEDWAYFTYAVRDATAYNSEQEMWARRLVGDLQDGTTDEQERAENEIISFLNKGAAAIAAVALKVWSSGDKREPEGGVLNNMEADTDCYIVAKHTVNIPAFHEKRRTNERDNIVDSLDRSKPIVIPNIDTSRMSFVFPHQAEYIQAVDRGEPPQSAIIGAAPGGGKTNCIIADINLLLAKGLIKRPVVVVPNNLVRQFVAEINEFTNGKMNAFPFTYQHVRDVLMNPFGMNMTMAEVIAFIRDLPRNTIIVTNYNTLRNEHTDAELKSSYEQVSSYDNFGSAKPLKAYPFVDILAGAGLDYVCGDESHKIKNQDSGLAQAFLCLCAKAEYVRLSSGTTINNVVTDLVGQTQKINPAMLGGDVEAFAEAFLGDKNAKQIGSPEDADAIDGAMREYSLVYRKDSRSWDYMLPKMQEIYHRVQMTELQTRYYNLLFQKAISRIKDDKAVKGDLEKVESGDDDPAISNKIERVVRKHFSVIDRFVNDPTQFNDFVDGTFVYEEFKFKNDGEEAEPGTLELAIPEADDLISVKAAYAYDLMYAHMDEKGKLAVIKEHAPTYRADPGNKVILMAPNKFVGKHVWDNMPPDLKKRSVRYQAGAFDKVEQFKTDDKIRFMVADEISISEGHNLQVGSRIIRMQQVWTPGGETQSLARIRRPDPFGKFNRDSLGYDIIVATKPSGAPTIDDLRIARLLAKKFNNAMVEFGYVPSFRNTFFKGDVKILPPVRMSMKIIQSFPEELLNQYFEQQKKYNNWFQQSSLEETKKIGREVESLTGQTLLDDAGRPLSVKDFVAAVVVPTIEGEAIPGSASCYVPWLPGVQPINPMGFDMQPIRSLTVPVSDEDEDSDEEGDGPEDEDDDPSVIDNVEIKIGDYVMTEFGPGIVDGILRNGHRLTIRIPGLPPSKGEKMKRVRLPKTCVYVPMDEEGAKTLANAIRGKSGAPVRMPKHKPITNEQRQEADKRKRGRNTPEPEFTDFEAGDDDFDEDDIDLLGLEDELEDEEPEDPIDTLIEEEEFEDEDEEEEDEEEETEATVALQALAINGQLAIVGYDTAEGNAMDTLYTRYGFKPFPDMARVGFKNRKALDVFLARVSKANYVIPRNLMAEIEGVAQGLSSRGKLRQVEPYDFSEITNFMKVEQKRVPTRASSRDPQTFRLYPIVQKGEFYLCASISKHPFNVLSILGKLMQGIPNTEKVQKFDDMGVKFYRNISEAKKEAKKIIADGDILEDPEEFLASFDTINGGHIELPAISKPTKPAATITDVRPARPTGGAKKPISLDDDDDDITIEEWPEQKHNPVVEDFDEFMFFLKNCGRATITLITNNGAPIEGVKVGAPMWVRKTRSDHFALSPYKDAPESEYVELGYPTKAKFDADEGLMLTSNGKRVWSLSYNGVVRGSK